MAIGIVTRAKAKAQGLPTYFTGRSCKHGHIAARRTASRACIECMSEYHAKWYARNKDKKDAANLTWAAANPSARRAHSKRWREKNPEGVKENSREWEAANPDKRRALNKRKYAARPDHYRAKNNEWARKNPDKKAVVTHRRRARKASAGGTHTAADLADILRMQKHRCAHPGCGADLRKVGKHLDHIIPLSRGGSNDRRNLQWLCPPHNMSKGAKDPIKYAQSLGLLL